MLLGGEMVQFSDIGNVVAYFDTQYWNCHIVFDYFSKRSVHLRID